MKKPLKNFVMLPRSIKDDLIDGKLTKKEFDVLIWVWLNANPVYGYAALSYEGLKQDLRDNISYASARKIISSLRTKHYIHFVNHRGKRGSFYVYPIDFQLSSKIIQDENYLKNRLSVTTQSQHGEQPNDELQNNLDSQYHNFKEQKEDLIKCFSMDGSIPQITTSNKENKIKNYKEKIDIEKFFPKNYDENKCLEIAKSLGEKHMDYMLSCLRKYSLNKIEMAWGIVREEKEKIDNPSAYFNKTIQGL